MQCHFHEDVFGYIVILSGAKNLYYMCFSEILRSAQDDIFPLWK